MTLTAPQIEQAAYTLGFSEIIARDSVYLLPSKDWVIEFAKGLPSVLDPCGMDCDDYALGAVHYANIACKKAGHPRTQGHTFGWAGGVVNPAWLFHLANPFSDPSNFSGPHAFNLCLTNENQWLVIEPQTGRVADLATLRVAGALDSLDILWL